MSVRTKHLMIRANEYEMATYEALARLEKLAVSTFIRRRLLLEAEQRGIVVPRMENQNRAVLTDANAVLA